MFCALLATSLTQTTVDLPRFPSLSPNGDRICFSWRGTSGRCPLPVDTPNG